MALAHPSDERRPAPQSLPRRDAIRAPETASGGLRHATQLRARRNALQSLTASGKTRRRYDRPRRAALLPQSNTVQEVVVHARPRLVCCATVTITSQTVFGFLPGQITIPFPIFQNVPAPPPVKIPGKLPTNGYQNTKPGSYVPEPPPPQDPEPNLFKAFVDFIAMITGN